MSNVAAGKDTDDEGEVLNDVEKTLNSLNIALRSSKGEWRSFEDVLDEVAAKWKSFSDTERSHIATAIAGTRQQENFRAMMNNWDEVTRLVGVAADSTGSASERMEVYLDSIEAKTNKLKASWENFVMSLNQSESWGEVLDILSNFLDKLTYVDWDKVIKTLTLFLGLTAIIKVIGAITQLVVGIKAALAAGGIIAGIGATLSGLLPVLLAISGVVTAIIVGVKSVKDNTESNVKQIQKEKEALKDEEKTVNDLYETYKKLKAKEEYYGLTTEEKKQLKDASDKLVETYGLEASGLDDVTGGYVLATDALKNYTKAIQEQNNALTEKEKNELLKKTKKDYKEIKKTGYGNLADNKNLESDLDTAFDFTRQINGRFDTTETRARLKSMGLSATDTGAIQEQYNDAIKEAEKLGKTLNQQQEYAKQKTIQYIISQVKDYKEAINTIKDDMSNYIKATLGDSLSDDMSNMLSESLTNAFDNASFTDKIDKAGGIENYLKKYSSGLKDFFNDNEEEIKKINDKYNSLKKKKDNGTLTLDEYDKYNEALKERLNLNQKIYSLMGLSQEEQTSILKKTASEAVDTIGEEFNTIKNSIESLGKNSTAFKQFASTIMNLNTQFKDGKITASDYFGAINKQIDLIDLNKLENTFGSVENFGKTLNSLSGEVGSYLSSIFSTFEAGGDSLEFFNNFMSASKTLVKISETADKVFPDIDKKINNTTENAQKNVGNILKIKKQQAESQKELRKNLIESEQKAPQNYLSGYRDNILDPKNILGNIGNITGRKNTTPILNPEKFQQSTKDSSIFTKDQEKTILGLADTTKDATKIWKGYTQSLEEAEEAAENNNNETKDFTKQIDSFKDSLKQLDGMDLNGLDSAYQNIVDGFATMADANGSLINTTDSQIQSSATKISSFLLSQAKANNQFALDTLKNLELISGETSDAVGDATKLSVEQVNQAILASQSNATTGINGINSIAQSAMKNSMGRLADVLDSLSTAIQEFDITIPISMEGIKSSLKVKSPFGEGTLADFGLDGFKTDLKIGGGTVVSSTLKGIANNLRSDSVQDIIASSFTPVEAEYIPLSSTGNKDGGKTSNYTPSGGGSKKGSGSEYSAEDAASDLKDILQDIEDYEADIELELEDQTEELITHYNLERNKLDTLKEELDYYDSIYDVTENTTKWLDTQLKILDEESKKVAEIQNANDKIDKQRQKIYNENSSLNVQSWFDSEGNETLAYGDLLNSFEYRKNQIEKETAAAMRAEYNKVASSKDKDTISAAKDRIKQIEEEGDIKIKQIDKERDYVENVYDSVSQLNDAWKDNQEAIREALQELNDRVKSIRDELIDDIMEQLERAVDKMNTSIEKDVIRLEQLKQVQESYNDILNDTIDTQQELEDELKANMDSYQYLDETMRQLMFNEDDYKQLSGVLEGIQSDIADIWEDHYNQIQNLTEDEMYKAEYITNETERQLAAKQKEYDLAKAELDVAKAQTNLNNVKNERNTRIFANGEWQWVANPDDVKSAQQQLMEAEREKTRLEREAEQQLLIDKMDKMIDSDNLQIDKNNELLEKIQDAIEKETEEVKSIEEALMNADKANLPALTTTLIGALGSDGGYMKELLGEINHSQVELAAALRGQTVQQAIDQLKSGTMSQSEFEELTKRLGFSFNPTTGIVTTQDGSFAAHYKGWVKKSNSDTQLGTAANGVQVTGGQAGSGQANAATSGGNGGGSSFPRNGKVTTSSLPLRIRSGAGTQYKILGTMPKGANVTILGEANSGWAQVKYGSITGYASRQYLSYDQGGIASGIGYMPKATLEPERVLSPRQTKAFEKLVNNITTNPVLNALSRVPSVNSKLGNLAGETNNSKNYYFSNFTVQADDIKQFINSIETIMPMKNK